MIPRVSPSNLRVVYCPTQQKHAKTLSNDVSEKDSERAFTFTL
jgi:hypothetical protein